MDLKAAVLENSWVRLEPLTESHDAGLRVAAGDLSVFRHMPSAVLHDEGYDAFLKWTRAQGASGAWIPFAVIAGGVAVGQTSYMNPRAYDGGVEIGATWYAPAVQGGAVNPACKLLLLGHAFASGAERVELKTDSENARSRAAILKLGANFEGIHRRHMRRPWGGWRDTAWYSILREEWPGVKSKLEARLAAS